LERTYHRPASDSEIEQRVRIRLARAGVLDRLDIAVRIPRNLLTDIVGSSEIMVDQLDHLATMAERPNIDLRLLASETRSVSAPGSFTLLATAGAPGYDLVCLEWLRGFTYHEDPIVVQDFADLFDRLTDAALSSFESMNLIRKLREDHRR
jgi:hypothetical protein